MNKEYKKLPRDVQERLRNKAAWEKISLGAVMRDYPELWQEDDGEDDDETE